ncbi:27472_t:CDS:1, partial [Dentiscutata erythropus]
IGQNGNDILKIAIGSASRWFPGELVKAEKCHDNVISNPF